MQCVKAFVSEAASSRVVVQLVDEAILGKLNALGFRTVTGSTPQLLSTTVSNQMEKAQLFSLLRDEEVCFSAGPDWCPADVFEHLRDQGMLAGKYRRIAWTAPGKSLVTDC